VIRIFRHSYSASSFLLFLCETAVVASALYAAASYFSSPALVTGLAVSRAAGLAVGLALFNAVLMYSMGLYDPPHVASFRRALPRLIACVAIGAPLLGQSLSLGVFSADNPEQHQAILFAGWTALVVGCVVGARLLVTPLARTRLGARRVLVVGAGKLAAEIEFLMAEQGDSPTEVVGYVSLSEEAPAVPQSRLLSGTKSLLEMARELGAREIVVALDDRRGMPLQPLLEARMEGIAISSYLSFWERETRRLNLRALDPSWLIYADGFHISTATNTLLKRLLDVAASLLLLFFTLPLFLLAALAIRFDSVGPVIYRQERVGRYGRRFNIYKFRTMRVDAERENGPQWASVGDNRVTRIGAFLRKTRIDELPQVLNVLKGEMSFVGPRPERPFFVDGLTREIPYYTERHRVQPGITGWAQINYPYGASIEDAKAKLSYDLYYIKNFSFLFDLLIILSTAKVVLFHKSGR
jgi:sugar transferase (PEP-CTERM system associated)